MIYIEETGGIAIQISLYSFRKQHPNVSFPVEYTPEAYEPYGVFEVVEVVTPAYDPDTQKIVKTFVKTGGIWEQVISVAQLTPAEIIAQDDARVLTRPQFTWWRITTELDDAWADAYLQTRISAPALYAQIKAEEEKDIFQFGQVIDNLLVMQQVVNPPFDVVRADLLDVWKLASAKEF